MNFVQNEILNEAKEPQRSFEKEFMEKDSTLRL
jgi:hypothetical protein